MKDLINKIEVNDASVKRCLEWLAEADNHALNDDSPLIRYLLKRVNELEDKINSLTPQTPQL